MAIPIEFTTADSRREGPIEGTTRLVVLTTNKATDPHQPHKIPWSCQKEDEEGDSVVAVVEDVIQTAFRHHTIDHHSSVENPRSNTMYSIIRKHNKHKNTETILKHLKYTSDKNTQNTLQNS